MAKRFVQVSLATKLRLLFGAAVLGIIAAALLVPWYFMELVAEQGVQPPAEELTRLRLNEWLIEHPTDPEADSDVARAYMLHDASGARRGPSFVRIHSDLTARPPLDFAARGARRAFIQNGDQEIVILPGDDAQGRRMYRCFRAMRSDSLCMGCHGPDAPVQRQFSPGQLVGMIDVSIPSPATAGAPLVVWTRAFFVIGGALAALLAVIVFAAIIQRLILRPVRQLREVSEHVAEGDLTARSTIRTGDELQQLGESFNEMVTAISDQHGKLRSANKALDLKLHELAESNIALFQANKVKSEFLANVSHELRTPLNSIIGFADLIAESGTERIQRYGQNIATAAKNLLAMINDILDLAKIEAGRAEVHFQKVSISDTCQMLVALMQPLAEKKHLDLSAEIPEQLPMIVTDPGKVQQVLYNLLSNAVKYTPAGGRVRLEAWHETGGRDEVHVCVSDTGPGIAEADQQHVFEQFQQLDRSLTKEQPGAGLGLAIAKELAGLLRGKLTLQSTPGHGATFTLVLPVQPPEEALEAGRGEKTAS